MFRVPVAERSPGSGWRHPARLAGTPTTAGRENAKETATRQTPRQHWPSAHRQRLPGEPRNQFGRRMTRRWKTPPCASAHGQSGGAGSCCRRLRRSKEAIENQRTGSGQLIAKRLLAMPVCHHAKPRPRSAFPTSRRRFSTIRSKAPPRPHPSGHGSARGGQGRACIPPVAPASIPGVSPACGQGNGFGIHVRQQPAAESTGTIGRRDQVAPGVSKVKKSNRGLVRAE